MSHPRTSRRTVRTAASVIALSSALVASAVPATADPGGHVVFRDHLSIKDSHIEQEEHEGFCPDVPFLVRFDATLTFTDMVRTKGTGDLEYWSFKLTAKETYTNVDTGKSFSANISVSSRDQKLSLDDGILSIQAMDRMSWKLFDENGKLVGVDAGLTRIDAVIDLGDLDDPDDDEVISEEFTDHGIRLLGERDICTDIMTFIG